MDRTSQVNTENAQLLAVAGIEIVDDCDQPGMFVWYGADISYDSRDEAVKAAALEISSEIMGANAMSDEEWDGLGIEQKLDLAREIYVSNHAPAHAGP